LQFGLVHPSVRAAKAVFEELELLVVLTVPRPRIIPWVSKVEIISAEVGIVYREGITGSHLAAGGMERIIIPLHVSSDIA
jgi:hypothetical protein